MAVSIVDRANNLAHRKPDAAAPITGRMLRVAAVAELLDLPEKRVYELVRAGVLPHVRLGRSIRFNSAELEAWIAAGGAGYPGERQ